MDLRFTPEELAFRDEVRAFFREAQPADIRRKMELGQRLSKDDIVTWQRILNRKGWAVPGWTPEWSGRAIHPGHWPSNWPGLTGVADKLHWRHLAYVTPEHRATKLAQYESQVAHLNPFEIAHARSIGDGLATDCLS